MIHKKSVLTGLVVLSMLLLTACGGASLSSEGNDVSKANWIVPDFTFTNQDGEPFGLADLKDKVWVADFIFTNCTTVCLPMSTNMAELQAKLEEAGVEAPLISFTVDPDRDQPDVLKAYGERYGANFNAWQFLTGYSFDEIKEFAEGTFKSPTLKPQEGDDQFTHGVLFYLVKGDQIIKTFNGVVDVPFDAIINDIQVLQKQL